MATKVVHALARRHAELVLQQHNIKEQISLAWKQLRTRGLRGEKPRSTNSFPSMVPRCGIDERASAVFLQSATSPGREPIGTLYSKAQFLRILLSIEKFESKKRLPSQLDVVSEFINY